MMCVAAIAVATVTWAVVGYSLAFDGSGDLIGGLDYAFLPDGGFFLADGYGSYRIHRYDKNGNWLSMFGAPGTLMGRWRSPARSGGMLSASSAE